MQKIVEGYEHLEQVLGETGCRKYLLVCDSSFPFLFIRDYFKNLGLPYAAFDEFTPNPLYEDVCKGVDLYRRESCDTIVAIGGGSTIDVAKCIKLYAQMDPSRNYLEQPYTDTGIPLIAIPTTAGTGSESTRYAVIYFNGKKQSVTHDSIIPDYAILEPELLRTLPLYQKKCTMMDALCQGIESWWSVNSTVESQAYSRMAVEGIMHHWHAYIFDNAAESRQRIMLAANLAGRAICITQTTAPHAFSYKLTSLYGIPHGHAVSLGLPEIWDYMLNHLDACIDSRGKGSLAKIFEDIAMAMGANSPSEAISVFRQMMNEMQLFQPQSENWKEDVNLLSSSVNPIRLKNNPVELEMDAIKCLYKRIVKSNEAEAV